MLPVNFPKDTGKHKSHYEWWYAHGYLTNEAHQRYGFMFSFFKFDKQAVGKFFPSLKVYPGKIIYQLHLGLTDIDSQTHLFEERTFIPALGRVGMGKRDAKAFFGSDKLIQISNQRYDLQMNHHNHKIHLHFYDQKGPVLHGAKGAIKIKGLRTTFYYSQPHLAVEGQLKIEGDNQFVHGKAWMDHQWGDFLVGQPLLYWTWIAIQLDSNQELMIFEFFDHDGQVKGRSATWVDQAGHAKKVKATIKPIQNWLSPKTKVKYAVGYQINVPGLKLKLELEPAMLDQEMQASFFPYWEGAGQVKGQLGSASVTGRAYLEQTGFSKLTKRGQKKRLAL